jgi:endonuclease/exonuclease/phosphatase family metal-dependent hydrolase
VSPVRLLTFNIHHGVGDDGRHDLPRLARLLAGTDADVICLQEVDRHFGERSALVDQAELLSRALDMELAWGPAIDEPPPAGRSERRQYGNALLSRRPVLTSDVHRLPGGGEPRSALRALIRTDTGALAVTVTHLSTRAADRASQAAALATLHAEPGPPAVLAGDLNAEPDARELDLLRKRLRDAWELAAERSDQAGTFSLRRRDGLTYPARRPRVRIDHVWVSSGVAVRDARVLDGSAASDHHPLLVDLELTEALLP